MIEITCLLTHFRHQLLRKRVVFHFDRINELKRILRVAENLAFSLSRNALHRWQKLSCHKCLLKLAHRSVDFTAFDEKAEGLNLLINIANRLVSKSIQGRNRRIEANRFAEILLHL